MKYYRPDPVNALIIQWTARIIVLLSSVAIVALIASIAINAVMVLGGSIAALIRSLITMIGSASPIVQLSLEIVAFCVLVALGAKLFRAIIGVQEVRGAM